jgi:nitroreductase
MPEHLTLTPDELLTTTRAVRKRLDFTRPVPRPVLEECLTIAQQAPTGSNLQNWHFVVIDPGTRQALADLYRKGVAIYLTLPIAAGNLTFDDPQRNAQQARVMASIEYLAEHLHEVPVLVIPCIRPPDGRCEGQPAVLQSSWWSSIAQAGWSFMLAARARAAGPARHDGALGDVVEARRPDMQGILARGPHDRNPGAVLSHHSARRREHLAPSPWP